MAPIQGWVTDSASKEKIILASVAWKTSGKGCITDSNGHFSLHRSNHPDTLIISCVGYSPVTIAVGPAFTGELHVELTQKQADKVLVMARYSRGALWWKKLVQYKAANDVNRTGAFSCDLYKKLELDLNNITRNSFEKRKLLRSFTFLADNIDTLSGNRPFLPVFVKETLAKFYYSARPRRTREEIAAVQTSGVKNEGVLHLIDGFDQRIDVYSNYITLFGKEFISPLSDFGDAHYVYKGADTQYIDNQRYLHLFFSPKHPGENTFSGDCWIHQGSWAISRIQLEIGATANINFVNRLTIHQDFFRQGNKWLYARDQSVAEIAPLKKDRLSLIARQTRIYQSVRIDPSEISEILAKNIRSDEEVELTGARQKPAVLWQSLRPEPLSANEQKVYKMVDTLNSLPLFRSYARTMEFLIDGHRRFGKVEIGPWYKWMSGNQREKLRLRFDLATTEKFSKQLRLHWYLAYGFADKEFKGQADIKYKFPGNSGYTLQAAYLHDLDNGRARNEEHGISADNLFSQLIRRPGIRQKFVGVDELSAGAGKEWTNGFSAQLLASRTSYTTFNPLPPTKIISLNERDILNTELALRLRYAPGEKKITMLHKDRRIAGDHPVFELGYAKGLPGIAGSQYNYQKWNAAITQGLHLPGWGQLHYQLYGGQILGDALPFMLLQVPLGNETYYYSRSAFNLMSRFEFVSDRYAGFSVEHNFDKKLLNLLPFLGSALQKWNIRQFWNAKAVWGTLSAANKKLNHCEYGSYHMRSLNGRPYIELGTGLDNLFTYFRIDAVWRFAPPQPVHPPQTIQPARTGGFGLFGSAHIQF